MYLFWPHHMAYGILVPQLEIEPVPPAVEAWDQTPGPPGNSLLSTLLNHD